MVDMPVFHVIRLAPMDELISNRNPSAWLRAMIAIETEEATVNRNTPGAQAQADAVAQIALSLPEQIDSGSILAALNRAYGAGFAKGVSAANRVNSCLQSVVFGSMRETLDDLA